MISVVVVFIGIVMLALFLFFFSLKDRELEE